MSQTGEVAATGDGTSAERSAHVTTIFTGLMLGMLVAAVSQTIVSPAMPPIVAELGGIEHYSVGREPPPPRCR